MGILTAMNGVDYHARAIDLSGILRDAEANAPDGQAVGETERVKRMLRMLQAEDTWESYREALALWRLYNIKAPEDITEEHKPDKKHLINYLLRGRLSL